MSLDGRPIGEHRYTLHDRGDIRELRSEALFNVRILFINAYRYEHSAREQWQGDCLERVDARTDANLAQRKWRDPHPTAIRHCRTACRRSPTGTRASSMHAAC